MEAVRETYVATINTSGTLYCGLTLKWGYSTNHGNVSIPRYVDHALQSYSEQPSPHCPQHAPHPWKKVNYGVKQKITEEPDISPALPLTHKTCIQKIIRTLIYYGRPVDSSILSCLRILGTAQGNHTEKDRIRRTPSPLLPPHPSIYHCTLPCKRYGDAHT